MPGKDYMLSGGQAVTIYKRRGSRNLRLSITSTGKVRVTIPAWVAYGAGLAFAQSRQGWINEQRQPRTVLETGQAVGKSHHLEFVAVPGAAKVTSRVVGTAVVVRYPADQTPGIPAVQKIAVEAGIRALRHQAEQLLPQRLVQLAVHHGFTYRGVTVKRLKGRWGSCDQYGNIVLNLFLMKLPWELIDYVLLHELTHTRVLRHGPDFWQSMAAVSPQAKALRKQLRDHQPVMSGIKQIDEPMA